MNNLIIKIMLKEMENKYNLSTEDKNKTQNKLNEYDKVINILKISLEDSKSKNEKLLNQSKSSDEFDDLKKKYTEALISRKNLSLLYMEEKTHLMNKVKEKNLFDVKKLIEINHTYENENNELKKRIIELNNLFKDLDVKLKNELIITKNLNVEKIGLLEKIKNLTLEISNLSSKVGSVTEDTQKCADLSLLNTSLLNDLKKQITINKGLETTINDLQEKIKNYNSKVKENEILIKNQLEIIRKHNDEKPVIDCEQKNEILFRSKIETDLVLQKIQRLENDPIYKS